MLDDELFRETAILVKSNSDRRKHPNKPQSPPTGHSSHSRTTDAYHMAASSSRDRQRANVDPRYMMDKPYISAESGPGNAVAPLPGDHEKPTTRPVL